MLFPQKDYSVSFCTTCMNRTNQLDQTFMNNVETARKFGLDCEFILINYNSSDHLEEWVRGNLLLSMDEGIVRYYKATEPEYWFTAHAKNIAHLMASKELLVNLDADNIINEKYLDNVMRIFRKSKDYITYGPGQSGGRIVLHRDYFYKLGGYSEDIIGYGKEDSDLYKRAIALGLERIKIANCQYIDHSDGTRISNMDPEVLRHVMTFNDFGEFELANKIVERIEDKHPMVKASIKYNTYITWKALRENRIRANAGKEWGSAKLLDRHGKETYVTHAG